MLHFICLYLNMSHAVLNLYVLSSLKFCVNTLNKEYTQAIYFMISRMPPVFVSGYFLAQQSIDDWK